LKKNKTSETRNSY